MVVRLVLAEDGFLMREGIASALALDDGLELVSACGSYDELLGSVDRHDPDVVITDIRMPLTQTSARSQHTSYGLVRGGLPSRIVPRRRSGPVGRVRLVVCPVGTREYTLGGCEHRPMTHLQHLADARRATTSARIAPDPPNRTTEKPQPQRTLRDQRRRYPVGGRFVLTGAHRATVDDLHRVVEVLTASHLDYVWEQWALPWDDRRERLTCLYESDVGTLAFRAGEVWMTDCCRSVAVWLPADAYAELGPDERRALDASAHSALGERISIIDEIENAVAAERPPADWHLATMGTLPHAQRQGLGTAVLQPRLTVLDQAHATAVLETSEPGNLEFYGRLGFEIVAELAQLPHSAPTTWIMRRSA